MPPTIIIPDIHNYVDGIDDFLEQYSSSQVIFLGDYFDSKHTIIVDNEEKIVYDTEQDARKTANWLKQSLQKPNRTHLIGNHDIPYLFPCHANKDHFCPGWTEAKHAAIADINIDNRDLKLAARFKTNWLISHAGISEEWVPAQWHYTYNNINAEIVEIEINKQLTKLTKGIADIWITEPGKRMGRQNAGGLLWCDLNDLKTPKGINQIVGHTPQKHPASITQPNGTIYGVDVENIATLLFDDHVEFRVLRC